MKKCSKCGEDRPVDSFAFKNKALNKRHAHCKMCMRAATRKSRGTSVKKRRCRECSALKFPNDFPWKKVGERRQTICKKCQRWYSKSRYDKLTPEQKRKLIARSKKRKAEVIAENRQRLVRHFADHPCVDCGENDIILLECDHVSGKKDRGVGTMISKGLCWDRIKRELDKCVTRCVRCHRKKTAAEFGWWTAYVS